MLKLSQMEASIAQEIAQRIHDTIIMTKKGTEITFRWDNLYSFSIPDQIRFYVVELLKKAKIDCLLIGDNIIATNFNDRDEIANMTITKEDVDKMYRIAKRIFDIIRYRIGKDENSKWFLLRWNEMLDNGEIIPPNFVPILLYGLNAYSIPTYAEEDGLHICADNSTLKNPFFSKDANFNNIPFNPQVDIKVPRQRPDSMSPWVMMPV